MSDYAYTDNEGRLILPEVLLKRYGIGEGERLRVAEGTDGLKVCHPMRLAKLYIEPTNRCNLDCQMCIRRSWDEPEGEMSEQIFDRIMKGLSNFSPVPTVFFGGFGEPLSHPRIAEMVARAKSLGSYVELITNGTLLTSDLSRDLIRAGLDRLWVSLDGATPECYVDVRPGAALPDVLENVRGFRRAIFAEGGSGGCCGFIPKYSVELGIEFVAMKRNIADLPNVVSLARELGASCLLVTNILPYTREMQDEVLYERTLNDLERLRIEMPPMDGLGIDTGVFSRRSGGPANLPFAREYVIDRPTCPFIERGAGAIGWDGGFSPCLPLLHSHTSYVQDRERFSKKWRVGNIIEESLSDLWRKPEHISFRQRVQGFDFPPCNPCYCYMSEKNEEDCFGNDFPTCGGCLWAQGLIRCP